MFVFHPSNKLMFVPSSGFFSSIFILEKLKIENINHHKPAKAIAIREASSVSIPSIPGPSCIITNDRSS